MVLTLMSSFYQMDIGICDRVFEVDVKAGHAKVTFFLFCSIADSKPFIPFASFSTLLCVQCFHVFSYLYVQLLVDLAFVVEICVFTLNFLLLFFRLLVSKCCLSGVVEVANAEAKWVEHWELPENY